VENEIFSRFYPHADFFLKDGGYGFLAKLKVAEFFLPLSSEETKAPSKQKFRSLDDDWMPSCQE
jgi:hypothetical protein